MRGVGFLLGGFVKLKFMSKLDLHKGMGVSCLGTGLGAVFLSLILNRVSLMVTSFIMSINLCFLDIFLNVSILRRGKNNEKTAISLGFTFFCFGTIGGPYLVSILGIASYTIMGIILLCLSFIFFVIPPFPET